MRIVWIIPGSGDAFYCENCLRDFAAVGALRALGHELLMVPMYLPLRIEGSFTPPPGKLFFGGINVYLQQRWALFRRTPRWIDRALDCAPMLRLAGRMSGMVKARQLRGTLVSMLRGQDGRQAKELRRLVDYLAASGADVVVLSNALLLGLAWQIKARLKVPVVCYLQDEDEFIDALDDDGRREVWSILRERRWDADLFIAASQYYADKMTAALELPADRMDVVYGGLAMEDYAAPLPAQGVDVRVPPDLPVIGFLSRRCYAKGPDLLAEAFCRLKADVRFSRLKLRFAGGMLGPDKPLQREIRSRLARAGVLDDAEFLPHLELPQRVAFLRGLNVLSVPERTGEAGGRYVKEALACGVPVVQPQNGVFPELLAATGGGLLFPPGDVDCLVRQLARVLTEPGLAKSLASQGRAGVAELLSAQRSAAKLDSLLRKLVASD